MPIASLTNVETGATARNKLNEAIARANEVEAARGGQPSLDGRLDVSEASHTQLRAEHDALVDQVEADIAAIASLDGRLDTTEASLTALADQVEENAAPSLAHQLVHRPGDAATLFTRSLSGGASKNLAPIDPADVVISPTGPAVKMTGSQIVSQRGYFALESGTAKRIHFAYRRTTDTNDPGNDAVRLALAQFNGELGALSGSNTHLVLQDDLTPTVAEGRQVASFVVAKEPGPGVDFVAATAADYGRAFVQQYGNVAVTEVEIIRVEPVMPPSALNADGLGTLAGRDAFNAEDEGFVYVVTSTSPWSWYIRRGAAGTWDGPNTFEGSISAAQSALLAQTQAVLADFRTRYLGEYAVAPVTDPAGGVLRVGAIYWNTLSATIFYWDGNSWEPMPFATAADGTITVAKLAADVREMLAGFLPVEGQAHDAARLGGYPAEEYIRGENKTRTHVEYLTGSGTYTPPAAATAFRVVVVGGGGGGSGSGALGTAGNGTAGGNTTFGALTAGGGNGGQFTAGTANGGAPTGSIGRAIRRSNGQNGPVNDGAATAAIHRSGPPGGACGYGVPPPAGRGFGSPGLAAEANSGNGGAGAPGSASSVYTGTSGAGGAYIEEYVPRSMMVAGYAYGVGSGGTGGSAGTNGLAGGAGGSGRIFIEEFYL